MTDRCDEFALIARHFAPLARTPASRGLIDDVAFLEHPAAYVVTADCIVEGVHFLPDDPIDTIAQKALRVNISDIVAKGATPSHYLLTLQWPNTRPVAQIEGFAAGLARDQAAFGCALIGGDTTSTLGPLAVGVTMLGAPLCALPPSRSGAQAGDDIWVTGVIGDGRLGLIARVNGASVWDASATEYLIARYRLPTPRSAIAATIAAFATAAMDVSDGLLGDAQKIAAASSVRLTIDASAVPLSPPARTWLAAQDDAAAALAVLLNGGDDYEVLFTAPSARRTQVAAAGDDSGTPLTRIGTVVAGQDVEAGGLPILGHTHRLGS